MRATDAIKAALTSTQATLEWYLSDLSDADLLVRPCPGANHIAWQMGHMIVGESFLIRSELLDAAYPDLPAGFAEQYGDAKAHDDSPAGWRTKAEYVDLSKRMRGATIAALDEVTDADLDRASTGRMAKFAPKLVDLFLLVSNHTLMHAGQFTVVRRKLGKPVLF